MTIKIYCDSADYKIIKKYKPIIYIEFAPYLHKDFGYTKESIIKFIKKKNKL